MLIAAAIAGLARLLFSKELECLAERMGFELTLERKFKDMQRTGCAF